MLIITMSLSAAFATPPGSVCDGYNGQAFGQCNAYCEATDCDEDPNANQTACDNLYNSFVALTGDQPPCESIDYSVRAVYSGDDSIEVWIDGVQQPFQTGDHWWSHENSSSATLSSGDHVIAFRVWDVGQGAVGLGAFIEVDGTIEQETGDGSFVHTSTNPGTTFADVSYDDSGWSSSTTCAWHPWNSINLPELTTNGISWVWASSSCYYWIGPAELWFRTELVLP
jgi:hypothetical protein